MNRWWLENVMGCPLPRCLGRERSTSQGHLAAPVAVSRGENDWWVTKRWLDLVAAETQDRDLVSEFGGTYLNSDGLLNCALASIPSTSEVKVSCC